MEKVGTKEQRERAEKLRRDAREKQAARKRDTRRKILLGGVIFGATKKDSNGEPRLPPSVVKLLDRHLTRPGDRKLFESELRALRVHEAAKASKA